MFSRRLHETIEREEKSPHPLEPDKYRQVTLVYALDYLARAPAPYRGQPFSWLSDRPLLLPRARDT